MLPDWAKKDDKGVICLKSPMELYLVGLDFRHFPLKCCNECKSIMHFNYYGFDKFLSEGRGIDKSMEIFPEYTETSKTNGWTTISVDLTDEKLIDSYINSIRNAQRAAAYKLELVKGICYKLQFHSDKLKVNLAVKEDGTVLLYKLSETLADIVPDLLRPNSSKELLGTVYHFDKDFDLGKIKEEYALSNKSTLKVLFIWVEKLFRLNKKEINNGEVNLRVVKY